MSLRPQLGLFTPKLTKREDIDWLKVFEQADFKAIGLCQRHVQIDDTRRDWFGMPFLIDADCARVQGSPYVAELKGDEKALNDYLWQYELLVQGSESVTQRMKYRWNADKRSVGQKAYTEEEYFEKCVEELVYAGVYPHPCIAGRVQAHLSDGSPDFEYDANGEVIRSIPSPFEKWLCLHPTFSSQVIASLEYIIQWKRQDIYYDRLVASEQAVQRREHEARQARSQQYWAGIDAEREQLRQRQLAGQQPAPEWVPAPQLDMFGGEVAA
jgi:hypothetical protein